MNAEPRSGRGLVLVGARCTGKTTVGRLVAMRLGTVFFDLDDEIERTIKMPIRDYFANFGERKFRDEEGEALGNLIETQSIVTRSGSRGIVLATGGGIVVREANRRRLREFGFVVWLTADPEVLSARLKADPKGLESRPALTPAGTLAEIAQVLEVRTPLYREVADAVVDTTGRSLTRAADAVMEAWRQWSEPQEGAP
jgi:shikimate kinase